MPEICGYFKLPIWITFGVKSAHYRLIDPHVYVNTIPDDVAYPIEPTRYVLDRVTTVLQISALERDVETIW